MTLADLLRLSFEASVFSIVFKLGTAANAQSIFFLFERPSLLLRSLLSLSIIMPARRGARSGFRPQDGCQVGASHTGDIASTTISSDKADQCRRQRPVRDQFACR